MNSILAKVPIFGLSSWSSRLLLLLLLLLLLFLFIGVVCCGGSNDRIHHATVNEYIIFNVSKDANHLFK